MTKAKGGSEPAKARGAKVLEVKARDGEERDATIARLALAPGTRHAGIGNTFAASLFSPNHTLAITESTAVLGDAMARARNGDKSLASDILAAQAVALDTMFTQLAGRSAANMGQYLGAAERYMRLALKALAKLHQPREQTVKHVHLSEGGQAIVEDEIHQHQNKLGNDEVEAFGKTLSGDQSVQPERLRNST